MKGDRIAVPFELGWRIFTIKIHRFQHLKEDPHSDCEEYDKGKTYGACVMFQKSSQLYPSSSRRGTG